MKKIALVGLLSEKTIGDRLLCEVTKSLLKKQYGEDILFSEIDYFGRNEFIESHDNSLCGSKSVSVMMKIKEKYRKFILETNCNYLKNRVYKKEYKKFFASQGTIFFMKPYFDRKLESVELVIFCGGGTIMYDSRLDFSKYYKRVFNAVKEKNIPIAVMGAGIESKYNQKDARCQMFTQTLNDDCLKLISTRDDIDELNKYIKNPKIETSKIADVGVWASDVYDIKKNGDSKIIGIGVIVADRFVEHHTGILPEEYNEALVDTIRKLEARGEIVEIFNTGNPEDEAYAKHICKLAGKNPDNVKTAKKPKDILEIISNYKGIISSRLHSCIPAYSMDIPFVAISWNNKLKYFAQEINVTERVIEKDRLNADNIIEVFDKAIKEGYDNDFREKYKQTDLEFIDKCLAYL